MTNIDAADEHLLLQSGPRNAWEVGLVERRVSVLLRALARHHDQDVLVVASQPVFEQHWCADPLVTLAKVILVARIEQRM
ncbi:hypothetical protein VSS74_16420 [Conexibacter stalactiti]|uniref:Uncharacterized protein n=1 Tax=Conexibacter stalactiti TaxID=1940611 RepID=A0ABU4HRR7_9ACTN|nr:hypothetical protein [Conexibacter stalactiti]MDW5595935.1 hypothetical protein [Conexibacter stalactiti]MEC5036577.1 hypothetical protein [Conexibacter stalactiti]